MAAPPPMPFTPEQLAQHDDRGPALVATSWTLTCFASVFLGLRVYCKIIGHRRLWWDDWILIAAWVALVIDAALATHMVVYYTYGRHTWDFHPPDLDGFVLTTAVRATLTVTAIAWTKTAFAITLLRLTDGWIKTTLKVIIVTMNIAFAATALIFWVQCTPIQKSWTPTMEGTCIGHFAAEFLGIFSGSYSALIDFFLALLPWKLLLGLQMKRKEKIGAAIAMSMGVLAGIAAIVKTVKLPKLASPDIYDGADLVIWDITEAAVTMVGACIPVLRVLIRDVRSTRRYYVAEDASQKPLPGWSASKTSPKSGVLPSLSPSSSASQARLAEPTGDIRGDTNGYELEKTRS